MIELYGAASFEKWAETRGDQTLAVVDLALMSVAGTSGLTQAQEVVNDSANLGDHSIPPAARSRIHLLSLVFAAGALLSSTKFQKTERSNLTPEAVAYFELVDLFLDPESYRPAAEARTDPAASPTLADGEKIH